MWPAIELRQVGLVAAKEFRDRIRNRWVVAVAVVFTAFALIIAYFGAAQQGVVGFRGIEVTIASLVSLVIYLVPLIALILGFDAIVGERERGSLDLLLSMPLTRLELLMGKFLGLSAALATSTIVGFCSVGVLLALKLPGGALFHYAGFVFTSILLGMSFLSLAVTVSVFAADRTRASGAAGQAFPYLLLLNPADVFRILNIFSLEEVRTLYGLATVFPANLANPWLLASVMLAWIAGPLAVAAWRFRL